MTAIKFEKYPRSKVCPTSALFKNELISIAKIGKIVKTEIFAITSILSFLGSEMVTISGLRADLR